MNAAAEHIISGLETMGYALSVRSGNVCGTWRAAHPPPRESEALLLLLRQQKGAVIDALMQRAFTVATATTEDICAVTVDAHDKRALYRWGLAVQAGLIALEGKVLFYKNTGSTRIKYRCTLPPEWLEDAIVQEANRQYTHTLARIEAGQAWLREHDEEHPEYAAAQNRLAALRERLLRLEAACAEGAAQ